ncbi:MAG: hypothetical protein Q9196_000271 [Gyalolechia fulgens]
MADNNDPVHNVIGAYIFTGYVLAALLLTGLISLDLYQAYHYHPSLRIQSNQVSKQLQVFVALAVLTFSTLSYHMLTYLIYSYRDWAGLAIPPTLYPPDHPQSSPILGFTAHLWQWLTDSTLFYRFAKTICENSANYWWTLQALLASAASALFISIEGSRRQVPHLWAYLFIGQILPISFAQSLFCIAMILFPVSDPSRIVKVPGPLAQCVPLLAYSLFVFSAPLVADKPAFMPVIIIIRLLLLCPFICRIPPFQVLASKSVSAHGIHSGYLYSYFLGLLCSLVLYVQQTYMAMAENGLGTTLAAINSNPAVSALGYDFILYIVLYSAWATLNRNLIDVSM